MCNNIISNVTPAIIYRLLQHVIPIVTAVPTMDPENVTRENVMITTHSMLQTRHVAVRLSLQNQNQPTGYFRTIHVASSDYIIVTILSPGRSSNETRNISSGNNIAWWRGSVVFYPLIQI